MDKLKLLALHRHFLAADAVKQFLFVAVPVDPRTSRMRDDILDIAQMWSSMLRLQVFCALMYVVVEGYRELGCHDSRVDELLAQAQFVEGLRRFRNANFHFQEDRISPKILEFLDAEGSEKWAYDLYAGLKAFFEKQLSIREYFDSLPKRNV
jgi:hypothetical protein